jgi:hypothetical protein
MVYPTGTNRGPVSPEVPQEVSSDYVEACNVLDCQPKTIGCVVTAVPPKYATFPRVQGAGPTGPKCGD